MARKNSRTGISLFIGIVPVRLISLERQVKLSLLHLRFLQAEEVGIQLSEDVAEAFSLTGAQPVDVPRDEFHLELLGQT